MNNILTVMIPTYNRKNELIKTLVSLQNQTVNDFNIIISDNASNYSIEEEIFPLLCSEIIKKITVYHRPYNIGGANNIAGLFSLCNTKWAWFLGDDDIIRSNAVEMILKYIFKNPNVGGFWYSLVKYDSDCEILNSLEQYVELEEKLSFQGDVIFLSNKIYNIEIVSNYIYKINKFAYTEICQCIPMFEMLKNHFKFMVIFNNNIVEHGGFKEGITWDVSEVSLGLSTLLDYESGMNKKYHKRFMKCTLFSFRFILRHYLEKDNILINNISLLKRLYDNSYKYILNYHEKFFVRLIANITSTNIGFCAMKKIRAIYHNLHIRFSRKK